jgi:TolB-like protein
MSTIGKPLARTFVMQVILIALLPLALAQAQERKIPTIAVMPLSGPGLDAAASQAITDGLADELIKTGKVRVMERSQMESILKEQGFQQSGACDGSECAVQIGKLLSIEQMIVGSVGKLGNSYSVMVRSVDVKTGEVVATSRKVQRGEIDEVVVSVLPTLAQELTAGKSIVPVAAVAPAPAPVKVVAPQPVTAPKPDAVATAVPVPKSESAAKVPQEKVSRSSWGWWVAGGAAVAGGVAAAVLLSTSKSSSTSAESSGGTNGSTNAGTGWTSKVVW